ncbi:hypothetical protein HYH02_006990 [Chlamydomonas schloesseri]|uniref:Uncharacterized protein n=1 Tax=Chlamydomonas schloesseri TaxID=2026947 RepID=A0A835WIX4_9CHLO|nr:hypothetical protein HYH02_006990 [Chlamydomonas schloesseri]|eukprot:KAG2447961.1 hypothetical protein HYH02_006990 [Chlamydomonas schloesseri]
MPNLLRRLSESNPPTLRQWSPSSKESTLEDMLEDCGAAEMSQKTSHGDTALHLLVKGCLNRVYFPDRKGTFRKDGRCQVGKRADYLSAALPALLQAGCNPRQRDRAGRSVPQLLTEGLDDRYSEGGARALREEGRERDAEGWARMRKAIKRAQAECRKPWPQQQQPQPRQEQGQRKRGAAAKAQRQGQRAASEDEEEETSAEESDSEEDEEEGDGDDDSSEEQEMGTSSSDADAGVDDDSDDNSGSGDSDDDNEESEEEEEEEEERGTHATATTGKPKKRTWSDDDEDEDSSSGSSGSEEEEEKLRGPAAHSTPPRASLAAAAATPAAVPGAPHKRARRPAATGAAATASDDDDEEEEEEQRRRLTEVPAEDMDAMCERRDTFCDQPELLKQLLQWQLVRPICSEGQPLSVLAAAASRWSEAKAKDRADAGAAKVDALARDALPPYDEQGRRQFPKTDHHLDAAVAAAFRSGYQPALRPVQGPVTEARKRQAEQATMPFGEHAGKLLKELSPDYLEWTCTPSLRFWSLHEGGWKRRQKRLLLEHLQVLGRLRCNTETGRVEPVGRRG